jgi:RNA polymerase sigma-70 factor (ECF subfamily)
MALMASLPQREHERRLVEAAREDPVAFGALYEQHVDAIYAYAWHRVRDDTVAQDVVSETFHRALENLGRYQWRGVPFSAWLYRIASNVIAARYRHEPAIHLDEADHLHDDGIGPEQSLLLGERRRELLAAVAALPADQQQAVILRYGQGLRNKEIAHIMGRSEGAVKQLLHRAIEGLHRRLAVAEAEG